MNKKIVFLVLTMLAPLSSFSGFDEDFEVEIWKICSKPKAPAENATFKERLEHYKNISLREGEHAINYPDAKHPCILGKTLDGLKNALNLKNLKNFNNPVATDALIRALFLIKAERYVWEASPTQLRLHKLYHGIITECLAF
jgi:hypothetical protein